MERKNFDNGISYEELRADVITLGINSEYEVICYLVALGVPIKPYILGYISRLNQEYLINRIEPLKPKK
jgi:hypothetical protein